MDSIIPGLVASLLAIVVYQAFLYGKLWLRYNQCGGIYNVTPTGKPILIGQKVRVKYLGGAYIEMVSEVNGVQEWTSQIEMNRGLTGYGVGIYTLTNPSDVWGMHQLQYINGQKRFYVHGEHMTNKTTIYSYTLNWESPLNKL
jgi:hypothetical protein